MAAKSLWDKIEKWQQGFLSSKYYLEYIKTICQDYTQKYASFTFDDIRAVNARSGPNNTGFGMFCVHAYVTIGCYAIANEVYATWSNKSYYKSRQVFLHGA